MTVGIDTSGDSLHKRGYRTLTSKAPITETLAAALILLTPWKKDRILVDPFCGSGTLPYRGGHDCGQYCARHEPFLPGGGWKNLVPRKHWYNAVDEAMEVMDDSVQVDIQGYDADGDIVRAARENAARAGVDHMIHFQQRPVAELSHPKKYGFIITNPALRQRESRRRRTCRSCTARLESVTGTGRLVHVPDHLLRGCRALYWKKS